MLKHYVSIWFAVVIPVVCGAVWAAAEAPAAGATYYVALDGNDEHDGLSRQRGFLTIQRGVDALSPGDTLVITPGEYFESISRSDLGGPDADTVIRAEIPGTVVIRGDVPVASLRKVDDRRFAYAADFETGEEIRGVNELGTLKRLTRVPNPVELDTRPASFYHDTETGVLYLSASDLAPAGEHRYSVSLLEGPGIALNNPQRVRLAGLAVTGFGGGRSQGILLSRANRCVVSECRAYFNGAHGISINHGRDPDGGYNLIERCAAWANGHGIHIFAAWGDTIRDSAAFLNQGVGFHLYAGLQSFYGVKTGGRLLYNLAWGNGCDYEMKTLPPDSSAESCIGPGNWSYASRAYRVVNSLFDTIDNRGPGEHFRDNIYLSAEEQLDMNAEFADPANHDYRLQATSRFRGAAAAGNDLGPFPYQPNVFYLSPDGDDTADGLSISGAWATLARALGALGPGDTLYLDAGRYRAPAAAGPLGRLFRRPAALRLSPGVPGEPVRIRGRGEEPALIEGNLAIEDGRELVFERLVFAGEVLLRGGENVTFENCVFQGGRPALAAEGVAGLRVVRSLFAGARSPALASRAGEGLFLAGNVYACSGPAVRVENISQVLYSDYNSYLDGERSWQAGDHVMAFAGLPGGLERYSRAADPGIVFEQGAARPAAPLSAALGESMGVPSGPPLGVSSRAPERVLRVVGPELHSVSSTSANFEWRTTERALIEVGWGDTPECVNGSLLDFEFAGDTRAGFGTFSLTGLEPGRRYYFRLRSVVYPPGPAPLLAPTAVEYDDKVIAFETPAADPEPLTLYVAPDGDDGHSGLSAAEALRTIARAADLARAGDTVLIGGGVYEERILARATGTPERPITFAAGPGARVVLDGINRSNFNDVVLLQDKSHLRFDGLYFRNIAFGISSHAVRVYRGSDIRFSRCFFDGRVPHWSANAVYAWRTDGLRFENCAFIRCGMGGVRIIESPDTVFRNSVFARSKIAQITVENFADQKVRIENSIFTETLPYKMDGTGLITLGRAESLAADNNAFYLRLPADEREPLFVYGTEAWERVRVLLEPDRQEADERSLSTESETRNFTAAEFAGRFNLGSFWIGDPLFACTVGVEFKDREGKKIEYIGCHMISLVNDFPDVFATEPELVKRGIGLDPAAFADFHFNQ